MNRDKTKLLNRVRRIEGQARGIARMIEEDRYCIDILTQLQAVRGVMARVEMELLKDHIGECVRGAITGGGTRAQLEKADDLIGLLERTLK